MHVPRVLFKRLVERIRGLVTLKKQHLSSIYLCFLKL